MPVENEVPPDENDQEIPRHGIPSGACDDEPKGLPTSDRHLSETSAAEKGGDADAEKHRHGP